MTSLLSRYLVSLPQPHLSPCGLPTCLVSFAHVLSCVMHLIWSDCLSIVGSSWALRRFSFCSVVFIAAPISCLLAPVLKHSILGGAALHLNLLPLRLNSLSQFDQMFTLIGIELGFPSRIRSRRFLSHAFGTFLAFWHSIGPATHCLHIAPFTLTLLFEKRHLLSHRLSISGPRRSLFHHHSNVVSAQTLGLLLFCCSSSYVS